MAETGKGEGRRLRKRFPASLFPLPRNLATLAIAALLICPQAARAGAQRYEPLAASVRAALSHSIADRAPSFSSLEIAGDSEDWLNEMSRRLERKLPDRNERLELLQSIHYEASRAGLEPEMVLALVEVESGFHKYAISSAGARGYMQVMPFWQNLIGEADNNLFHLRTNLRYGCTILRHYLDMEQGQIARALGRYNGSLGRPDYPNRVLAIREAHWRYGGNDRLARR